MVATLLSATDSVRCEKKNLHMPPERYFEFCVLGRIGKCSSVQCNAFLPHLGSSFAVLSLIWLPSRHVDFV